MRVNMEKGVNLAFRDSSSSPEGSEELTGETRIWGMPVEESKP